MKNSSLAFGKGKAKKNGKGYKCSSCGQVFKHYQARGRHQKVHQGEIKHSIDQNDMVPSNISMNVIGSNPQDGNAPRTLSEANNNASLTASIQSIGTMLSALPAADPIYMGSSNIHIDPTSVNQHHLVPSSGSINVTNSNLGRGNGQSITLFDGNYYDYHAQYANASLLASVPSNGTMPRALPVGHPIYMGPFGNPISLASNGSFIVNHRFNVDNSSTPFAGYYVNDFSQPKAQDLLCGVNINKELHRSAKVAKVGNAKDAKHEDGHAILSEGPSNHGSVLEGANNAKENNEVELDLSLHL